MTEKAAEWLEKGFFITDIAPKIGIRESRRIKGNYTLSYKDIFAKKEFFDSISVAYHTIDLWQKNSKELDINKTNPPLYEIPYRCLITDKVHNLLVAGRCISGTHLAMSSYRVMANVTVLGQIAGIASYLAVSTGKGTPEIDVEQLRKLAKKQKVIVDRKNGYIPKYLGGEGKPEAECKRK